jgi:acyl-coenzyme A synthetase/AMP-(fatty) acid ligase
MQHFLALQYAGSSVIPLDAGTPPEAQEKLAYQSGADWLHSAAHGLVRLRKTRSAEKDVCVKLTSGSSGRPKRVLCTADHLLADGRNIIQTMGLQERDRNLALIPLGHSYGLGNLVMPLLMRGIPLVLAKAFVPGQIPVWIREHRVTVFPSVPAVFRVLATLPGKSSLSPLRLVLSAGAPLPPETARAFATRFQIKIHNFYGSSETGGICFDREGDVSLKGSAIGTVLHGVHVHLLPNRRLRVSGPSVATPSGAFTLPDFGEWTDSGNLRLLGRTGSVANLGGKKVRPSEIESALRQLPGVTDAAVCVLHQGPHHFLAAAVETRSSASKIRLHLAKALPAWKLPRVLKTVIALPRTERGKTDSKAILAWLKD